MSPGDEILAAFDALVARAQAEGGSALLEELRRRLSSADVVPAGPVSEDAVWHGMIGNCPQLVAVRSQAQKFAKVSVPVLIRGESGTGKDVLAKILHRIGPRAQQPFVSENCAAIPENLLESVLFGHKKGAFTGAIRDHAGHFVAADKGSLFLDEIGDMPLSMQAKLLRTLQEGEVRPVGGTAVRKVDVRILAATNQDLEAMVAAGSFREDLYYRLNVLQVELPPLRERGEDVVLLARHFLEASAQGRDLAFSGDAVARLREASWPGNIRQLQNEIQRAAVLTSDSVIRAADFSPEIS